MIARNMVDCPRPHGENALVMRIYEARSAADLETLRTLFREYAAAVDAPACFVTFEQEVAGLPGDYAPPSGSLHLAQAADGTPAGCVALRNLSVDCDEMKRLYVRAAHRGNGLGRELVLRAVALSRARGRRRLVLDTLPSMTAAIALYRDLGFRPTPAYSPTPTPGALFFELRLS